MWAESEKCGQKSCCNDNILPVFTEHEDYSSSAHIFEILTTFFRIHSIFLKRPFWKMWSESQKCGQKSCCLHVQWILVIYYHYNSSSAHISQILPTFFRKWPPLEKTAHFGAKKLWNGAKKKCVAPAHILNVCFAKKTDSDWSTLASGRLFIKFRSI